MSSKAIEDFLPKIVLWKTHTDVHISGNAIFFSSADSIANEYVI